MNQKNPKEFEELVKDACIKNHKKAWELIESLQDKTEIMSCYKQLLESDYKFKIRHIESFKKYGSGLMKECAIDILQKDVSK